MAHTDKHKSAHENSGADELSFDNLADGTNYKKVSSTKEGQIHEKDKDTKLDSGGVNEVTAANAKDAVDKKHTQNTDTILKGETIPQYDEYTKLLIHFDGADGNQDDYIAETGQTVTTVGTAQLDTAQKKFGTASILLDGNGYCTIPASADWAFGTGNFTIDWWLRFNNIAPVYLMEFGDTHAPPGFNISYNAGLAGKLTIHNLTIGWIDLGAWSPSVDTWYHLALVRSGNTLTIYVDGVAQGTTGDVTGVSLGDNDTSYIGTQGDLSGKFDGWYDEIRVSKGIARWTENFTPPTSEYVASTVLTLLESGELKNDLAVASGKKIGTKTIEDYQDAVDKKHVEAKSGAIDPTTVTPDYIGQVYVNTNPDSGHSGFFIAYGTGQGNWTELS